MATFLCRALLTTALAQGTSVAPVPTDGHGWAALGRVYLARLTADRHTDPRPDTVWTRAMLDSADHALVQAVVLLGSAGVSAGGDSARVLRVQLWSERAVLAWESAGLVGGANAWGPAPADLRLSPVLEELGENLLRACPTRGVLLTAGAADSYAAWYMRYVRGLRSDLLVIPLEVWRSDATFRARAAVDLKLGAAGRSEGWIPALAGRRPVCISMAFEKPPDTRPRVSWAARPLVWVAGRDPGDDRVPPRDFVFAALQMALDDRDPWARSALVLYARAARNTRGLCEGLAAFKVSNANSGCRG